LNTRFSSEQLLVKFRSLNGYLGVVARRRLSQDQSKPVGTEVHQKPGPLQTIFNLPLDEVKKFNLFLSSVLLASLLCAMCQQLCLELFPAQLPYSFQLLCSEQVFPTATTGPADTVFNDNLITPCCRWWNTATHVH